MDKLVSVIVPVYNVEKYLKKCVNSIINQTYRNLEIILVDDGSPDRSPFLCDEFAKKDSRIKVVHKENGGLSDARNAGIEVSTGDYLMFVDSDDYIAAQMCEKLLTAIEKANADLSICNFLYTSENPSEVDNQRNMHMSIPNEILTGRDIVENKLREGQRWYWVVAWNKLYSRKLFAHVRFAKGKLYEDEFIFHKILLQCERVACVAEPLYFYVQRDGSIMSMGYKLQNLDKCEAFFKRADGLIEEGCTPKSIYYAISCGIGEMCQMFERGLMKEESYQQKYVELLTLYRSMGLSRLFCSVNGIKDKTSVLLIYLSPYYAWKLKKLTRLCGRGHRL